MSKKLFASLVSLLVVAAFSSISSMAQAVTIERVSNETTSICINPTEHGFEPTTTVPTKNLKKYPSGFKEVPNYKPLTKRHEGPFPDTGGACAPPEGAPTAFAIPIIGPGGPSNPAGPYTGTIANASWVGYNKEAFDNTPPSPVNPPPKYYIYDTEFGLSCPNSKALKAASITVHLFADNTGGAFINGTAIGSQTPGGSLSEHFDSPAGPAGGWAYTHTGSGFVQGRNVVQFVVLDETQAYTGIDFSAVVTAPSCTEEKLEEEKPEYWNAGQPVPNATKIPITINSGASKLLGGVVVECKSDVGKGDIEGRKKTVKLKIEYSECEAPAITASCQTSSSRPGVITTEFLKGLLVYASETFGGPEVVANRMIPETAVNIEKFTCGPKKELTVAVSGVVFAAMSPVEQPEALTGEANYAEKGPEPAGCTKQQLLYLNAAGSCEHLTSGAGLAWLVSKEMIAYKKPVKIKG